MTEQDLLTYLQRTYPQENTACEWKEFANLTHAVSGRKGEDIISYTSAIANMKGGQLVIGVQDELKSITGIQYFHDYTPENLPLRLIGNCTNLSSEGLQVEAFTTTDTGKTVWVLHIPRHQPRKPVYAHKLAWQRVGDSLLPLTPEREKAILEEPVATLEDWSAGIVPGATLDDLEPAAVQRARENYRTKFPSLAAEINSWDDSTFLNKAKITIKGQITRTAILLLGREEAEHFISPAVAKIRWILKDQHNTERDYRIFSCPFLLNVDEVYKLIRNLKYRYIKDGTLFPDEVDQYSPYTIREALHNCIAHQDYAIGGMINVVEREDGILTFTNAGRFLPGSVKTVIEENAPEEVYRNRFLVNAMFNLKMVDIIGSGIRRMFTHQAERYFPMPDYDLSGSRVKLTITGKVLDMEYARKLATHKDLTLEEVILLDKVQKKQPLTDEELRVLRKKDLVEGRKGMVHISAELAAQTDLTVDYMKAKGVDNAFIRKTVVDYLTRFGKTKRETFEKILLDKIGDGLTTEQKLSRLKNVLQAMKKEGLIHPEGRLWAVGAQEQADG